MFTGNDIALAGKRSDGETNVTGVMDPVEDRDNAIRLMPAVEERQEITAEFAMQQGVEGFGDQQRPVVTDRMELKVRGEQGNPYKPPILGSPHGQDPLRGRSRGHCALVRTRERLPKGLAAMDPLSR